jgi:hypothetical protein
MRQINTRYFKIRPFHQENWQDMQTLAIDWENAPGPDFNNRPIDDERIKGLTDHLTKSEMNEIS